MTRGLAVLGAFVLVSAGAFAQGAAEAALSHSLSTSMGTAVGRALGNAGNRAATQVAGGIRQQTSMSSRRINPAKSQVQAVAQTASGTTSEPPAGGSLIQSIEGAAPRTCVTIAQNSAEAMSDTKINAATASNSNAQSLPPKQDSCPANVPYKAVVNLPAAR